MTSDSLMKLGDETFGADDDLTTTRRIDRGIAALQDRGYVLGGPRPQTVQDEAGVVVYTFVREESPRDPVTRWGARLVLLAVVGLAVWLAVWLAAVVASALYHSAA
jgi:hypothetical protein